MTRRLTAKEYIILASMLFGMFFGAGNLIFPVHLGQLAGRNVLPAMIGFIVTYGAVIAINIINKKKGITINYKDVSEYLIPYDERQARKQEAEAAKAEA